MSVLTASLTSACVTSALWGIFLLLALASVTLLVRKDRRRLLSKPWRSPLLVASVILMCSITAHWILQIRRLLEAFGKPDEDPDAYLASVRHPTSVALVAMIVVTVVVYDLMIIARTWVVWNRETWVVIFPIITTLGITACYIAVVYEEAKADLYTTALDHWITAAYALNLSTNLYGTGMIACRILMNNRALKAANVYTAGARSTMSALPIFIESAALYAVWMLFFFAAYRSQSSITFFASNCLPVVSGISLMLITLRIGLGWAYTERNASAGEGDTGPSLVFAWPRGGTQNTSAFPGTVLDVPNSGEEEGGWPIQLDDRLKRKDPSLAESVDGGRPRVKRRFSIAAFPCTDHTGQFESPQRGLV